MRKRGKSRNGFDVNKYDNMVNNWSKEKFNNGDYDDLPIPCIVCGHVADVISFYVKDAHKIDSSKPLTPQLKLMVYFVCEKHANPNFSTIAEENIESAVSMGISDFSTGIEALKRIEEISNYLKTGKRFLSEEFKKQLEKDPEPLTIAFLVASGIANLKNVY